MNGYELSRKWFDWSFENPEKINPNHSAIYFYTIEHCNRLGWREKFVLPAQTVMAAIGIRKHQTYYKYFNDLIEWGFIKVIEKSSNQYSTNIISLVGAMPKNVLAHTEANYQHNEKPSENESASPFLALANNEAIVENNKTLTKPLVENESADTKNGLAQALATYQHDKNDDKDQNCQSEKRTSTGTSIGTSTHESKLHIIKPISNYKTKKPLNNKRQNEFCRSFEDFWKLFDYKKGKKDAIKAWDKIPNEEIAKIFEALPKYLAYLKAHPTTNQAHAATWLNAERWNDEYTEKDFINPNQPEKKNSTIEDLLAEHKRGII